MQCHDTGCTEAIRIPRETIELAQELQEALDIIRGSGHGDGVITLKVQQGRIPFIDWTFRKFRNLKKKISE